jgi:tetratricopeptide (TPR) repeat protein
MAKRNKPSGLPVDPAEALAQIETPQIKWKVLLQIAGAFAILWLCAFMVVPWAGYWVVGLVGVLQLVAIGFGIYVWRLTSKQRVIVDLMKSATDPEGRARAIEQLGAGASKDAMKALAQAQLLSNTDPAAAQKVLEGVDLAKAPAVVQDDVRSQLALMYLRDGRVKEARTLADAIRLDRQPNAKAKALYAAVIAECFARTGSAEEARKLMETYDAADPAFAEVSVLLLRARVFTFMALKKRGLAKTALDQLAAIEPNMLGGFLQKGTAPELTKLTRQVLAESGLGPKMKVRHTQ